MGHFRMLWTFVGNPGHHEFENNRCHIFATRIMDIDCLIFENNIKVQHFDHNNISTVLFIVKAVYCANYPSDEQIVTAATVPMYYNQQIIAKYILHLQNCKDRHNYVNYYSDIV